MIRWTHGLQRRLVTISGGSFSDESFGVYAVLFSKWSTSMSLASLEARSTASMYRLDAMTSLSIKQTIKSLRSCCGLRSVWVHIRLRKCGLGQNSTKQKRAAQRGQSPCILVITSIPTIACQPKAFCGPIDLRLYRDLTSPILHTPAC